MHGDDRLLFGSESDGRFVAWRRDSGEPAWTIERLKHRELSAPLALGRVVAPHEILFDAPPIEREVDFNIDVYFPKTDQYRPLGEISPVVRALGLQFDDYVKRVRLFAHPRVVNELGKLPNLSELVSTAIERTE